MSVATLSFSALVLTPLLLLVVDLFGRKAPAPLPAAPRGNRR